MLPPATARRPTKKVIAQTRGVQGLRELAERAGAGPRAAGPAVASAIDFVLEGLYAQKKISRTRTAALGGRSGAARARGARR